MHELSIAMSLIDIACEEAQRLGARRVEALHVRIGPLAGVVTEALTFSFALATDGTAIAGARLVIDEVPLIVHCVPCDVDQTLASPQHLRCPQCGGATPDVVSGRELLLVGLEIDDDEESMDANHPTSTHDHVTAHR